jgi:hypothetical protein
MKDRELNSGAGIKEVITNLWREPTFIEVQGVFHN